MKYLAWSILKIVQLFIIIFWIFDILDFPFMEIFDTEIPINGLAWLLIALLMPKLSFEDESPEENDE